MNKHRVGFGFDVHRFAEGNERRLILGGVEIEGHPGLVGHSDADVIAHAITDAVLGAAGLGDIGQHFPDDEPKWKDVDSMFMLRSAVESALAEGWTVGNVDCTIVTERPKISPHRAEMERRLSECVDAPVTVKAGRAEGLGAIGRVEGAACWAVALLEQGEQS